MRVGTSEFRFRREQRRAAHNRSDARPGLIDAPAGGAEDASVRLAVAAARRRLRNRSHDSSHRRALGIADALAATLAMLAGPALLGGHHLALGALAVPAAFVVICKATGLYDRDQHLLHKTTLDELPALFAIATLGALLLWLSNGFLIEGELGRPAVLTVWLSLLAMLIAFRTVARSLAGRLIPPERCVLIGDAAEAEDLRRRIELTPAVRATLVGFVPAHLEAGNGGDSGGGLPPELVSLLAADEVDRVILRIGSGGDDEFLFALRQLKLHGVKVSILPGASRVAGSSVEPDHLQGVTLLGVPHFEISRSSRLMKRGFDLAGASIGLVLTAPVMALVAVAIKLDSPGPVLFRGLRAGRFGEPFRMLKFRSMVEGADALRDGLRHLNEAEGVFKIANDPRVTKVGRVLRRLHLDELPQLVNVVRGEMSLVGPRPLQLDEDRAIEGRYRDRLQVRPGITGYWQVLGSARIPVREMVKLDYLYLANWSLWNDVRLILRTIPLVLRRRGL